MCECEKISLLLTSTSALTKMICQAEGFDWKRLNLVGNVAEILEVGDWPANFPGA